MHLRGDRVGLVHSGEEGNGLAPGHRRGIRLGGLGQLGGKGVDSRAHGVECVGVGGQVDDQALLREQGLAHLLEPTEEGRPIVLGLREHLLDRIVVRDALRELADVAVQRVAQVL